MEFIDFLKYLLLGIVQGITEVLPISSSGHVELFKALLGVDVDENLLFLIVVNTGSLGAFLVIFAGDILRLAKSFFLFIFNPSRRDENREGFTFVIKLGIATIPAALVGVTLSHAIDAAMALYGTLLSGLGLFFTGTILLLTSRLHARHGNTGIGYVDAALIGVAQAVALIPGISRSGTTTSTAIARRIGLDSALKFSFLMYIPVSLGSILMEVVDFAHDPVLPSMTVCLGYFAAFVAAITATFVAYRLVFGAFRSGRLKYFSFYCFAVGLVSIVLYVIR
jgi:undecaprenyl-diphosphatase